MAKIYGQLERAQLETTASDFTSLVGRMYWNTTDLQMKVSDGTAERNMLRNDGKAIIGASGTAADNIRLHRGGAQILQLLLATDTTTDGTLSANLAQVDSKLPSFTDAGLPANGNPGRIVWNSTFSAPNVDDGSAWNALGAGGGVGSFLNFYSEPGGGPAQLEDGTGLLYYDFEDEASEILWAFLKIPSSYQTGKQIKLKVQVESDEAGSNQLILQAQTYLVRSGTDAMTALANSHTDTANYSPSAVAATELEVDLTDGSGQVNAIAVSAGDILKIALSKPTDSSTENLRLFESLVEVSL